MLYSAWDRKINISLFFATFLYENEAPGLEQAAVFTMATTFKKGIFVHPTWVPNCIQKFEVGLKIFISHLILTETVRDCVCVNLAAEGD